MLARVSGIITILVGLSGIIWSVWDHVHPKPQTDVPQKLPSPETGKGAIGDHNPVTITTIPGNGNIVNNGGTLTIGSNRSTPLSEKETARQRLHDSGVDYSASRFFSALENHEVDIVALFTEAGMKLTPFDLMSFSHHLFNEDVAKVLIKADQTSSCPTDYSAGRFYTELEGEPLEFVRQICSKDSVRTQLRATIQKAQKELQQARQNDIDNEARRIRDISSCEQTMIETFGARVSRLTAHQQCLYRNQSFAAQQQPRLEEINALLNKAINIIGS